MLYREISISAEAYRAITARLPEPSLRDDRVAIGTFLVRDYVVGAISETSAWVMIMLGSLRQISAERALSPNEARNLARARTMDPIFVLSCCGDGF